MMEKINKAKATVEDDSQKSRNIGSSKLAHITLFQYAKHRPAGTLDDELAEAIKDNNDIPFPDEVDTVVADLLADIMHFCRLNDVDFDEQFRRARSNWAGEVSDEYTEEKYMAGGE